MFIVAQTADGMVIVDQHAAHERLVHERLKRAFDRGDLAGQGLLLPEVVELEAAALDRLVAKSKELGRASAWSSSRSGRARSLFARCRRCSATSILRALIRDLADDLAELGESARPAGTAERAMRDDGLPRQRPGGKKAHDRGDECPAARHGIDAAFGTVQPRPAHLRRAETQ